MTFRPFTIPAAKGKSFKTIGAIDVAARYLVYKLYEATDGQPMRWATLQGMGELLATVERALSADGSSLRVRRQAAGTQGHVNGRGAPAGA